MESIALRRGVLKIKNAKLVFEYTAVMKIKVRTEKTQKSNKKVQKKKLKKTNRKVVSVLEMSDYNRKLFKKNQSY